MKVYLAGRSEDQRAILTMRTRLAEHGIACTSRWLDGFVDDPQLGALQCLTDIAASDVLVLVNLKRVHRTGTGGRHVEVGIALAGGMPVIVYGERENVFHHLRTVHCLRAGTPMADLAAEIRTAAASRRSGTLGASRAIAREARW